MRRIYGLLLFVGLIASATQACEAGRRQQFLSEPQQSPAFTDPAGEAPVDRVIHTVKPSEADPSITRFDEANVVMFNRGSDNHAQLVVFLPGTNGKPEHARLLLSMVANQGYRVIGLTYNDEPAVVKICPHNPDPDCSAKFRQKRIFGDDVTQVVDNSPNEAVVSRLVKLLQYLDATYPQEGWRDYLAGDGPNWNKIVVSGLSQGAGMAAYIAKQKLVARVVLFSSPWDFIAPSRALAPWISGPSVTPPDRWYAEYHRRENTADLLARSYKALGIPEAHIQVFNGEPENLKGDNPYHATTIRLPVYVPEWQEMFGKAP